MSKLQRKAHCNNSNSDGLYHTQKAKLVLWVAELQKRRLVVLHTCHGAEECNFFTIALICKLAISP